ncbi:hypothetical protein CIY_03490 [Butyrivibrio fibrisolvens 16/4]|nr:hypothetical protein CIY_03490 [Butyrivibrio fibrisolvens 16/4]
MYVIVTGSIEQVWKDQHLTLGPGTIAGLSDALNLEYEADYTVAEDSMIIKCPYKSMSDFDAIFEAQPVYIFGFSKGAFRQCRDVFKIYDSYKKRLMISIAIVVEFIMNIRSNVGQWELKSRKFL